MFPKWLFMIIIIVLVSLTLTSTHSTRGRDESKLSERRHTRQRTEVNEESGAQKSLFSSVNQPLNEDTRDVNTDFTLDYQGEPSSSYHNLPNSNSEFNQLLYGLDWADYSNLYDQSDLSYWKLQQVTPTPPQYQQPDRVVQKEDDVDVNQFFNFEQYEEQYANQEENQFENLDSDLNEGQDLKEHTLTINKIRRRCYECFQKHKQELKHGNAPAKLETIDTRCEQCKNYFCENCFNRLHGLNIKAPTKEPINLENCPRCNEYLGSDLEMMLKHTKTCRIRSCLRPDSITSDYKYICSFCPFHTRDKTIMRNHLVTHTGDHPFVCPHCKREFTQKTSLKRHIKNRHLSKE